MVVHDSALRSVQYKERGRLLATLKSRLQEDILSNNEEYSIDQAFWDSPLCNVYLEQILFNFLALIQIGKVGQSEWTTWDVERESKPALSTVIEDPEPEIETQLPDLEARDWNELQQELEELKGKIPELSTLSVLPESRQSKKTSVDISNNPDANVQEMTSVHHTVLVLGGFSLKSWISRKRGRAKRSLEQSGSTSSNLKRPRTAQNEAHFEELNSGQNKHSLAESNAGQNQAFFEKSDFCPNKHPLEEPDTAQNCKLPIEEPEPGPNELLRAAVNVTTRPYTRPPRVLCFKCGVERGQGSINRHVQWCIGRCRLCKDGNLVCEMHQNRRCAMCLSDDTDCVFRADTEDPQVNENITKRLCTGCGSMSKDSSTKQSHTDICEGECTTCSEEGIPCYKRPAPRGSHGIAACGPCHKDGKTCSLERCPRLKRRAMY
jgi:hypothetical protein